MRVCLLLLKKYNRVCWTIVLQVAVFHEDEATRRYTKHKCYKGCVMEWVLREWVYYGPSNECLGMTYRW